MKTGWQTINNHKYYFSDNGRMLTGWLKLSTGEYYFATNGNNGTGFTVIGENTYYFNDDGKSIPAGKQSTPQNIILIQTELCLPTDTELTM